MISFSPCGVLKPCVYCVPFSSQSGGGTGVCVCVRVCMGGMMMCVCVWFVVTYIPFFPRLCFVFPKGVTAFKGLFTPGNSACNILSSLLFFPLFFFKGKLIDQFRTIVFV